MEVLNNNTICKDCQMQANIQKRLMGTKGNHIYNSQNGKKKGEGKEQPKLSTQVVELKWLLKDIYNTTRVLSMKKWCK
jgi:hypothetical protein